MLIFWLELTGQTVFEERPGKISFISSQYIYVKFKTTEGISQGDTLYILSEGNLVPVTLVKNLSSTSCLCTSISALDLSIDKLIIAKIKVKEVVVEQSENKNLTVATTVQQDTSLTKHYSQNIFKQNIRGSLSFNSYSDFSNTAADNTNRFRYTLSLDARNLAGSKFSFENYMSFKHKAGDWEAVKSNIFNGLKIYNLALKFDFNKTTRIIVGRKINSKISNIGAMDGLQFEKAINKFAFGAIAGTRPDYSNYGFNHKLLQYGAYMAFNTKAGSRYSESSLAFMQQMNNSITDRRFLYFQHSNSIINDLNIFSTFEADLYKLNNDSLPRNTFSLTGLYLSLRYKMTRNLSWTASYDARKNVIYYETYKSFIDRIIEEEMRQSFRLQANYKITKYLMFGLQAGYRFLKTDPHPSKNLYTYLTYSQIPRVNLSATITGTYLKTNYLNGKILGIRVSREFLKERIQAGLGYRYVDYSYPENILKVKQNIAEADISVQFSQTIFLSVNYEGTFEQSDKYNRIYLQVRKRF